MRLKEIFAGHRDFHGGDICNYLKDGSYYFPFIIYREQIKNHNNLSMANKGFENPCELIVKDHEGLVYLAVKTVSAESMSSGKKMGPDNVGTWPGNESPLFLLWSWSHPLDFIL